MNRKSAGKVPGLIEIYRISQKLQEYRALDRSCPTQLADKVRRLQPEQYIQFMESIDRSRKVMRSFFMKRILISCDTFFQINVRSRNFFKAPFIKRIELSIITRWMCLF
ncbi:hypothetical protein LEP1GSC060_3046 [Leptospira weilii serovar Ranarum str. ICFT]|uniref:Uncharacterized protein n=1 Tax=Leptospira weilii serovar Ranarum str. ICFT TaxID=1218598 RepID=N1WIW6_9LEPT|nr:hypothetical protein LEP1GSC060_3046 [Leptospira weilii serovar Ranarum str. ICFT]